VSAFHLVGAFGLLATRTLCGFFDRTTVLALADIARVVVVGEV
jgi:hypothetical protein